MSLHIHTLYMHMLRGSAPFISHPFATKLGSSVLRPSFKLGGAGSFSLDVVACHDLHEAQFDEADARSLVEIQISNLKMPGSTAASVATAEA